VWRRPGTCGFGQVSTRTRSIADPGPGVLPGLVIPKQRPRNLPLLHPPFLALQHHRNDDDRHDQRPDHHDPVRVAGLR